MTPEEIQKTQSLLRRLGEAMKRECPKDFGFFLCIFPFGDTSGRANYISTAQRKDAIKLLRETAYRLERNQDEGSMA